MRTSLVPLILCFVLTLAGLTLLTSFHDASTVTHVWGMPVIAFGAEKPAGRVEGR